jgi:hypothetical protein
MLEIRVDQLTYRAPCLKRWTESDPGPLPRQAVHDFFGNPFPCPVFLDVEKTLRERLVIANHLVEDTERVHQSTPVADAH